MLYSERSIGGAYVAILISIAFLLPITASAAPTWVTIDPEEPEGSPPDIEILEHTTSYTKVKVTVPGFWKEDVVESGETYQKLSLAVGTTLMADGKPELPCVSGLLGVPAPNDTASVTVLSSDWEEYTDYMVWPHQPDYLLDEEPPDFEIDEDFYATNLMYPGDPSEVSGDGMLRDIRVVNNRLNLFRCNPADEELEVASEMTVKVNYSVTQIGAKTTDTSVHADFIPYYEALIWNVEELDLSAQLSTVDYLIITGNDYNSTLGTFVTHLEDRDFSVDLVKMSDVALKPNALTIYHYIRDSVEDDGVAYVLLVGDCADAVSEKAYEPLDPDTMVPIPYWLPDTETMPYGQKPSDTCYACLDNSDPPSSGAPIGDWEDWWEVYDFYPDVYLGRFTADTIDQVEDQINKTIYYEDELEPPDPIDPWYDKMVFVANKNDPFPENKELLMDNEYFVIELPPVTYLAGNAEYQNTNSDVTNAVEGGCFIVNYYGHGLYNCWDRWTDYPVPNTCFYADPGVKGLGNDYLPVVFNVACNTAWIDDANNDVFSEYWVCSPPYGTLDPYRGGVAAIGGTRGVASDKSITFDEMLFRTMYGDPETIGGLTEPRNIIGTVLFGGLTKTKNYHSGQDPYKILEGIYVIILLGDPSLRIRNIHTEE